MDFHRNNLAKVDAHGIGITLDAENEDAEEGINPVWELIRPSSLDFLQRIGLIRRLKHPFSTTPSIIRVREYVHTRVCASFKSLKIFKE